jgi:hypothetical protein
MRSTLAAVAKLDVRVVPGFFLTSCGKRLLKARKSVGLETHSTPILPGRKLP